MNRISIGIAAGLLLSTAVVAVAALSLNRTMVASAGTTVVEPPIAESTPLAENTTANSSDEDVLISAKRADIAPELAAGKWINAEPTTIGDLKGKVVYLEFWTFGCFNCVNTLPTVKRLNTSYGDQGLAVIGVETPELEFEKSFENLKAAVKKRQIEYAVLTDYESKSWEAYGIQAWPTILILDKQGRIRYRHLGEGAYDTQEKVIQTLLAEKATS